MTQRLALEAELRKFLTAIEQNPSSVVITDCKGAIEYVNSRFTEVTGYSIKEAIGQNPRILKSGTMPQFTYEELWYTILSGKVWRGELHNKAKDGTLFWESISISPLRNSANKITHFVAVKENISSRKQIEAALMESNKELQRFVYTISHDLQEPVRTITSFANLLAQRNQGKFDGESQEFMEFITDGTQHMSCMIRDLVDFSRINTKGKHLLPVNSYEIIHVAIENLVLAIEESKTTMTMPDEWPIVLGDRGQLIHLFQNILSNAIKYRNKTQAPRINIRVQKLKKLWHFAVQDNGIGIESRFFEKIFAIFQRLHDVEEYEGTGIGLALCKRIVERHGGTIWLESTVGQGTTFFFTLMAA
ncbi:hypothetical protein TI04_00175 [Achromatium sp. WMS2]|nr:hypothetical protein TI04_00175 [Achromatium sp. WMS2]